MAGRIDELPEHDRPRERLLRLGHRSLSDGELLALLLRYGSSKSSALDIADALLRRFGSPNALAGLDVLELSQVGGVGIAKASTIVAALALGGRATTNELPSQITCAADVAVIAQQATAGMRRECAVVLVCDSANRLRNVERISAGAIDHTLMPVREVLQAVLRRDGKAFAVAHNHPSGDVTPSAEDAATTRRLVRAAEVVGLRFLDHVVVSDRAWQPVR